MQSVLQRLYRGDLYPYQRYKPIVEEYQTEREKAFQSYQIFFEKLPEHLKDDFNDLIDDHIALLPLELEESFIEGFQLGARMISEVYFTSPDE